MKNNQTKITIYPTLNPQNAHLYLLQWQFDDNNSLKSAQNAIDTNHIIGNPKDGSYPEKIGLYTYQPSLLFTNNINKSSAESKGYQYVDKLTFYPIILGNEYLQSNNDNKVELLHNETVLRHLQQGYIFGGYTQAQIQELLSADQYEWQVEMYKKL